MEIQFEDLDKSDFFIDCVYKGGKAPNMSSEPFHKLIPGCENAGGFRKKLREDGSGKYTIEVVVNDITIRITNSADPILLTQTIKLLRMLPC